MAETPVLEAVARTGTGKGAAGKLVARGSSPA